MRNNQKETDRDVLLGFPDLAMKSLVHDSLREMPKITVEGQQLMFYSYLCPLTFQKRRDWKMLTTKLPILDIPYKWSFPLTIDSKGATVVTKTLQQAEEFTAELEAEKVEVEVLNAASEE